MNNAHLILLTTIIMSLVTTPWWHGALYGAGMSVAACLFSDIVEGILKAIFKRGAP